MKVEDAVLVTTNSFQHILLPFTSEEYADRLPVNWNSNKLLTDFLWRNFYQIFWRLKRFNTIKKYVKLPVLPVV